MRTINLLFILIILAFTVSAQDIKYETSDAVDISKTGYDRLLQMRNGNTLLFHFEYRKGIVVKVFDATHKEIASQKHLCKVIDINILDHSFLSGLYDINGEAVLFISQAIDNRTTIVRLRIDATTAKLISEEKLLQSESFQKQTLAEVKKDKNSDIYFIVSEKITPGYVNKQINITKYNGSHELVKDIRVPVNGDGSDYFELATADIDEKGGLLLTAISAKIIHYGNLNNYVVVVCYLPPGDDNVVFTKVELPGISHQWHYSNRLTANPFANSLNLLLTLNMYGMVQNGATNEYFSYNDQLLLVMNSDMSAARFINLNNVKIKEQIAVQLDTSQEFSGEVISMYTNQYGLSTVLYRGTVQLKQNLGRMEKKGARKSVALTQYNDIGEEIYGGIFPVSQIKSYNNYHDVFGTTMDAGLTDMTSVRTKYNYYVLYNDVNKDYGMKLSELRDSVYNCAFTNAQLYKLDRKKQATHTYLLGEPVDGEYKHISANSGNLDEKTNTYAVLFLDKKGKEYTSRIAWCHFE